mmetsp:Transcript_49263/g.107180  ORF Transcript_49263/g.107180 Transcript_49263/m.107180 type:complete len:256 (+) Transcript_49263:50-817(+)
MRAAKVTQSRSSVALAELSRQSVEAKIAALRGELKKVAVNHAANVRDREEWVAFEQRREQRLDDQQARQRRREEATVKIQALVRGGLFRRLVLPDLLARHREEELVVSRQLLSKTLVHMRQAIHDVAVIEEERAVAAIRIESWWRGVLARRVVGIVRIRNCFQNVGGALDCAATCIERRQRGIAARSLCRRLRREREEKLLQAKQQQGTNSRLAAVKLQTALRTFLVFRATRARRAKQVQALLGPGDGERMRAAS